MSAATVWPKSTVSPWKTPLQHIDPLVAIFHDLRRHPELDEAVEHLAAAIRGVEAVARPLAPNFAATFPARGE